MPSVHQQAAAVPRTCTLGCAAAEQRILPFTLLSRAEHMCCYLLILLWSIRTNKNLPGRLMAEAADVAC